MTAVFCPRLYRIIGTLNEAIAASTRIVEDEKVRDELIGQAKFLRAFIYFNLVRVFSDVPYIDFVATDLLSLTDISKTGQAEI